MWGLCSEKYPLTCFDKVYNLNMEYWTPVKSNIKDPGYRATVDLLLHKRVLRVAVPILRKRLRLPEEGLSAELVPLPADNPWSPMDQALYELDDQRFGILEFRNWVDQNPGLLSLWPELSEKLRKDLMRGLSKDWDRFFFTLVFFNQADDTPALNSMLGSPQPEHHSGKYSISHEWWGEVTHIDLTIYNKISKKEWADIFSLIKEQVDNLPNPIDVSSNLVEVMSTIADARRAKISYEHIAINLLSDRYDLAYVRQLGSRAKKLGL